MSIFSIWILRTIKCPQSSPNGNESCRSGDEGWSLDSWCIQSCSVLFEWKWRSHLAKHSSTLHFTGPTRDTSLDEPAIILRLLNTFSGSVVWIFIFSSSNPIRIVTSGYDTAPHSVVCCLNIVLFFGSQTYLELNFSVHSLTEILFLHSFTDTRPLRPPLDTTLIWA